MLALWVLAALQSGPAPDVTARLDRTHVTAAAQADEVLRSIGQQELKTRRDRTGQTRRAVEPGVKDW